MRLRALRALPIALLALAFLQTSACKKKSAPVVETQPVADAPEAPVPAPDGIVAEGVVKSPDAMLASLRSISLLIPEKAGGLFADLLHVPKEAAREIDGSKPVCFVVIKRAEATSFAVAVPLVDAEKASGALERAAFKKSEDAELGATIFEGTSRPRNQVVAVRRKWLVASSSLESMKALAPYVTRTMPARPLPKDDVVVSVPEAAMRGPALELWKSALEGAVQRRKEALARAKATGGTAGAGGAPLGLSDLLSSWIVKQNERSLKWLADAGDARVVLDTDRGAIQLRAEVAVPDAASTFGKALAGWSTRDASSLLAMPTSSVLAFETSESAADRATSSNELVQLLAAKYPNDLPEGAREKLSKFLEAWDAARGDFTSGAIVYEDFAHVGAALRLATKDPKTAASMLKEALAAVFAMKGVSAELASADVATPTFSRAKLAGVDADVLTIAIPHKKGEATKPGAPESADFVFGPSPKGDELLVVVGTGARELFPRLVESAGDGALGGSGDLAAQVKALGPGLAAALVVFPGRVVPLVKGSTMASPPPPSDGVAFTMGKTTTGAFLTLDLAKPAVETLARLAFMSSLR